MRVCPVAPPCLAMCLALSVATFAHAQDTEMLRYPEARLGGWASQGTAGYSTGFVVPEGSPVLKSVWVRPAQPANKEPADFTLVVSDMTLAPVAIFGFQLACAPMGDSCPWVELRLDEEVRPPKDFAVTLWCCAAKSREFFMTWSPATEDKLHSVTLYARVTPAFYVERRYERYPVLTVPIDKPTVQTYVDAMFRNVGNWSMGCEMAKSFTPPADPPLPLLYDSGAPKGVAPQLSVFPALRFKAPEGGPYALSQVLICTGFYGSPALSDGQGEFAVNVLDPSGKVLGKTTLAYTYGSECSMPIWVEVPFDRPVPVSGEFDVYVEYPWGQDMRTFRPTPALFVAYDTKSSGHSKLGTPGQLKDWTPEGGKGDWCIRCELVRKKQP